MLDALTANPDVWARTVLFLTFDENDGFFDHVTPPSPLALDADGKAGSLLIHISNGAPENRVVECRDRLSGSAPKVLTIAPGAAPVCWEVPIVQQGHWYDVEIAAPAVGNFLRRLSGRIETGTHSTSRP